MSETSEKNPAPGSDNRQLLKLVIELGPLIAFFTTYVKTDIFTATVVLMVATVVSLAASKILIGHVAVMPVVTAVLVCVFGGLTVYLQDPTFIKVKPTILYVMFAAVLAGGLWYGKVLLKFVLGEAMSYTDEGWRKLTLRWAGFFLLLAVANEVVWRGAEWYWADIPHVPGTNHPAETLWVNFKTFGFLPLTMAFAVSQFIAMRRYEAGTK